MPHAYWNEARSHRTEPPQPSSVAPSMQSPSGEMVASSALSLAVKRVQTNLSPSTRPSRVPWLSASGPAYNSPETCPVKACLSSTMKVSPPDAGQHQRPVMSAGSPASANIGALRIMCPPEFPSQSSHLPTNMSPPASAKLTEKVVTSPPSSKRYMSTSPLTWPTIVIDGAGGWTRSPQTSPVSGFCRRVMRTPPLPPAAFQVPLTSMVGRSAPQVSASATLNHLKLEMPDSQATTLESQSIASAKPSPLAAHMACACHCRACNSGSPSVSTTSTHESDEGKSILFSSTNSAAFRNASSSNTFTSSSRASTRRAVSQQSTMKINPATFDKLVQCCTRKAS
mmetsp:Transcript_112991/g.319613  ORF Transcript_112991/g.319613 Transcript_112991/m.319613 type:complete len:340 (-) Transcript_112991:1283-2302(-)